MMKLLWYMAEILPCEIRTTATRIKVGELR